MIITRGQLHIQYQKLTNEQKNLWAEKAGYIRYAGLLQYLKSNADGAAYTRVIEAFKKVIGDKEFSKIFEDDQEAQDINAVSALSHIAYLLVDIESQETLRQARDLLSAMSCMVERKIAFSQAIASIKQISIADQS